MKTLTELFLTQFDVYKKIYVQQDNTIYQYGLFFNMLNASLNVDGKSQLQSLLEHWHELFADPNNKIDDDWFRLIHKEFRQVDVIDNFVGISYDKGKKHTFNITGYLDGLFYSIIAKDKLGIFCELLKETFTEYDRIQNRKTPER